MLLRLVCLLLLVSLPACTDWYVREGITLKELIAAEHPKSMRLTRADGSLMVVKQPRVVGSDSLAGFHRRSVLQPRVRGRHAGCDPEGQ